MLSFRERYRFWGSFLIDDGCWLWTGIINRQRSGYGYFYGDSVGGKRRTWGAHRLMWEIVNGPIPDGHEVCHSCDNPPCVNPAHLWIGTHRENMLDCVAKNRQGVGGPPARLSPAQCEEIVRMRANGAYQREIAAKFGVSQSLISKIVRRHYDPVNP